MRHAIAQLDNGLAFAISVASDAGEEERGVDVLGPHRALLFSHPGPVSLVRTGWPLDLVWLDPLGTDRYRIVAIERANPGTYGQGSRRAPQTRLLELPASWGLQLEPGTGVRVMMVPQRA